MKQIAACAFILHPSYFILSDRKVAGYRFAGPLC